MTGLATRRAALASALAGMGALAFASGARAKTGSAAETIDALAREVMAAGFGQPGLGIAVVEDGEVTLARGYGVLKLGASAACDERTLFGVASNTKAMTAALIAMLVDEGKVEWDAPVTRYLPDFAMSDPVVTRLMTVRDLLVHRSGLTLGAGDLMLFPTPRDRTRAELVAALRHLPIGSGFRAGYAYDNVLYVAAGALIERVTGQSWEDVLQARILGPLGMADSVPNGSRLRTGNLAIGHARLGPPIRGVGPQRPLAWDAQFDLAAPAGGVWASPRDIAKWMQVQLARGVAPSGRRLWSETQAAAMWTPQTITLSTEGPSADNPARPTLQAYALGWFVQDHRDERTLGHSGGLSGYVSYTALLPGRRSGVMIMTNAEEGAVLAALRYGGLDRLQGRSDFDWVASRRKASDKAREEALATYAAAEKTAKGAGAGASLPLEAYAGVYRDPWYGTVTVSRRGRGLYVRFDRSVGAEGPLEAWDGDTFRTRFVNPDVEDALITFEVESGRAARAKAKAFSPLADFSFDYQDLRLERVG